MSELELCRLVLSVLESWPLRRRTASWWEVWPVGRSKTEEPGLPGSACGNVRDIAVFCGLYQTSSCVIICC